VVAPGFTQTAMYERVTGSDAVRGAVTSVLSLHRAGRPEEVADAVMFLGSDKATYITGQTLTLDGGLMAGWPLFPAA
jgi:NAD(P)-dependent dehydrogenase (short-subunit alcohol dehydrogenase family)